MAESDPSRPSRESPSGTPSGRSAKPSGPSAGKTGKRPAVGTGKTGKQPAAGTGKTGKRPAVAAGKTGKQKAVGAATGKTGAQKAVGAATGKTGKQAAVGTGRNRAVTPGTKSTPRPGSTRRPTDRKSTKSSSESTRRSGRSQAPATDADAADDGKAAFSGRRPVRYSLAVKFSVPVAILILGTTAVVGVWAVSHMRKAVLNEILKNGASKVMGLTAYGRQMLIDRENDPTTWPVQGEYVTVKTFREIALDLKKPEAAPDAGETETTATTGAVAAGEAGPAEDAGDEGKPGNKKKGKNKKKDEGKAEAKEEEKPVFRARQEETLEDLPETLRTQTIEHLRLLRHFTHYYTESAEPRTNEVLDAYIMDDRDNVFVAGSRIFTGKVEIDYERDPWIAANELEWVEIGDTQIRFRDVGIDVASGWITKGGATSKVLVFEAAILRHGETGFPLGKAIIALSAEVIESEQAKLRRLMMIIGGVAVVVAALICVLIANLTTRPVKILINDMDIVAGGNLEHKTRAHSKDEIGQIAAEFNEMTRRLAIAHDAEKEAERLENELELAREIQMKLLPARIPKVKGFDIFPTYKPAKEVGGDYYDFFPIDKEHIGIIVADVSGKGIPGSMVMATTRTILRFIASGNTSAADALAKTNAIINADIKRGMFVTAFYLVLDARRKSMVCASAGHNPMVVLRANGGLELVNPNGIALGFDKGPIFQRTIKEERIDLASGDRVVLYTDGVVEAMNAQNEEYTSERFYEFCKKTQDLGSQAYVEALLEDLERHKGRAEQHDDITVVTLKIE